MQIDWKPIDTHSGDESECLIAIIHNDGSLYCVDRGWWTPGEIHEEWDQDGGDSWGIMLKIGETQDEGQWDSNYCIIEEPTHWAELQPSECEVKDGKP